MDAVAVSDLHGNPSLYELLLRVVDTWHISSVFIAGDLLPGRGLHTSETTGTADLVQRQRSFLRRELIPLLASFLHSHRSTQIYAIQGNDDCRAVQALLTDFDDATPNFHLLNDRIVELRDSRQMHTFFPADVPILYVAGYPYVPPGAGLLMDWVKYENRLALRPFGMDPCTDVFSMGIRTVENVGVGTIADDLERFPRSVERQLKGSTVYTPERTIHLFHAPPYNTALDWVPPGGTYDHLPYPEHVGSVEIRRFIERTQPHLVISGHCHESVILGSYREQIGRTPCINPGSQSARNILSVVQFDVYDPTQMKQFFINAR
jgi:Icc-related predicted phosphoesterase